MTDKTNSKFPSEAEVVIVGVGGIVGSMLAYWLTELGEKNIVGLEKSTIIPSDIASTAHYEFIADVLDELSKSVNKPLGNFEENIRINRSWD